MSEKIFSLEAALNRRAPSLSGGVSPVKILLVDNDPAVRKTLTNSIGAVEGASVCGEATDSEEAFDFLTRMRPELIVLRAGLPGMSGLQVTRSIMVRQPTPIIVTANPSSSDVDIAFESLRSGALALLRRPTASFIADDAGQRIVACARTAMMASTQLSEESKSHEVSSKPRLIIFLAGAGALGAAMRVLNGLPVCDVPILLATDIDADFLPAFVTWLNDIMPQGAVAVTQTGQGGLAPRTINVLSREMVAAVTSDAGVSITETFSGSTVSGMNGISIFDLLLITAAESLGNLVTAILFGHIGNAGVSGLLAIKQCGGRTFTEFPTLCPFAQAPGLARRIGAAEFSGSVTELSERFDDFIALSGITDTVS